MTNPAPEFKASDSCPVLFPLHSAHLFYSSPSPSSATQIFVKEGKQRREGERKEGRKGIIMVLLQESRVLVPGGEQVVSLVLVFLVSGNMGCETSLERGRGKCFGGGEA